MLLDFSPLHAVEFMRFVQPYVLQTSNRVLYQDGNCPRASFLPLIVIKQIAPLSKGFSIKASLSL